MFRFPAVDFGAGPGRGLPPIVFRLSATSMPTATANSMRDPGTHMPGAPISLDRHGHSG